MDEKTFQPLLNMNRLRMALRGHMTRPPSVKTVKAAMAAGMPWRKDPLSRFPAFVLSEVLEWWQGTRMVCGTGTSPADAAHKTRRSRGAA
jgi:hypothetical protein